MEDTQLNNISVEFKKSRTIIFGFLFILQLSLAKYRTSEAITHWSYILHSTKFNILRVVTGTHTNEKQFWEETNQLFYDYKKMGITVNKDTVYLNHFLTCVKQGIFPNLNNKLLKELGAEIEFYDGLPKFFQTVNKVIEENEQYQKFKISVEHYIVSTGLKAMIEGSKIASYVKDIWGCSFIEVPIKSNLKSSAHTENEENDKTEIKQIAFAIDNTSKTRALFEINKGANIHPKIDVNAMLPKEARRIPFSNMIYIADGPSDVPIFSVLRQNGGRTFAVYPKGQIDHLNQVDKLREDNRIDMYGEADYSDGTLTNLWLIESVKKIADKIASHKEELIKRNSSDIPKHII